MQNAELPECERQDRIRLAADLATAESRLASLQADVMRLSALERELAIAGQMRRELNARLDSKVVELQEAQWQMAASRAELDRNTQILTADRDRLQSDMLRMEQERQQLQATLNSVLSSRAWRLAEHCRRPLNKIRHDWQWLHRPLRAISRTVAGRYWRVQPHLAARQRGEDQGLPAESNHDAHGPGAPPDDGPSETANPDALSQSEKGTTETLIPEAQAPQQRQPGEEEMIVSSFDCTEEQFRFLREQNASVAGFRLVKRLLWLLPYFENPFYGGIFTILRFAQHWHRTKSVENIFAICADVDHATMLARLRAAYPQLEESNLFIVRTQPQAADLPIVDASICTLWTTAYFAAHHRQAARRFYFIQDFEPSFYRAGSASAIVEATYRMSLYGIANTISLKKTYESEYSGRAAYFEPCVDHSVFYPGPARPDRGTEHPFRIFIYGRPGQPRNAFELVVAAMRLVKDALGERVQIYSAGSDWSPSEYGLDGILQNLGLLAYQETARLYRETDVGVVMMLSRHPSYIPFELMASGCLVVTNVNSYTRWLLKDNVNCLLTRTTPSAIAETVKRGLLDNILHERIVNHAASLIRSEYSSWSAQMEDIYDYICDPEAYLQHQAHLCKRDSHRML